MNKATKAIAVILVLAGVLLAGLALRLANRQAASPPDQPAAQTSAPQHAVVVAARAITANTPLTAADLQIVNLSNQPAGGFADVADVIGQMSSVAIAANAPITRSALAHGMAQQLAPGERAVAIPVNQVAGVDNRIRPGDYVDVFFTLKTGQDAHDTQARLLASHLRVLSYGGATLDNASGGAGKGETKAPPAAADAVLAVPVDQVNRLALATQNGKLLLALRPPADNTQPDTHLFAQPAPVLTARAGLDAGQRDALSDSPENRAYAGIALAGLAGDERAAPKPTVAVRSRARVAPSHTIEVIRGAQRTSAAF